jgi:hypothetical protein
MDEAAREQLAQRLSAMTLKEVRNEIRSLDADADMVFWRNAIRDETQTQWLLPNAGVSVILVEKNNLQDSDRKIGGGPGRWNAQKTEYRYVEARVNPLTRPVKNY